MTSLKNINGAFQVRSMRWSSTLSVKKRQVKGFEFRAKPLRALRENDVKFFWFRLPLTSNFYLMSSFCFWGRDTKANGQLRDLFLHFLHSNNASQK